MSRDDHMPTAETTAHQRRIATAEAELARLAETPDSPDHTVWIAQAEVDRLKREYDEYLQSFPGKLRSV